MAGGLSAPGRWASILVVWVAAVVALVLVPLLVPGPERSVWYSLAFAGCVVLGMIAQLITQQKVGLVSRFAGALAGAVVLFAAGIGVAALVA